MILKQPATRGSHHHGASLTINDLFRRAGVRNAELLALADAPNREAMAGGAPRQLSYAEADRAVSAIAERLRQLGLPTDTIVAFQLPNTVESIVTFLGIVRAGMIAAPLPMLWRKTEIIAALAQVGAKVLISATHVGDYAAGDTAMQAAAELFPIRNLCAFGQNVADGVIPMDDVLEADGNGAIAAIERNGDPSAHIAVITWEITPAGIVPVARSHSQLIAGGTACVREGAIEPGAAILSATPVSSFAGLSLTLMPSLIAGGTLVLHHAFDPDVFAAQRDAHRCDTIVVPGPLLGPLAETNFFAGQTTRTVLALWRTPERLGIYPLWTQPVTLVDVVAFGEVGLLATRRRPGAKLDSLFAGRQDGKLGLARDDCDIELARSDSGMLLLRGTMVPDAAYPPGPPNRELPHLEWRDDGFVSTGYRCRHDGASLAITASPAGLAMIGGYRLARTDLDAIGLLFGGDATLAVLPNVLTGQRLAAAASDRATVRGLLDQLGINALITGAFRDPVAANAAPNAVS